MNAFTIIASFAGGYAASIYTWPKLKEWINGIEAELQKAKDKVTELRNKL